MVVCIALLLSSLTVMTAAAVGTPATVDPHTLDEWKQYFGIQTDHINDVELTTEFAGGVWTDKSVFDPALLPDQLTDAKYNGKSFSITDRGDNFLVALSAIASNKQIKGYSTIPTDTVLVLDLSSSMRYQDDGGNSAVDELIEATNKAIDDLLSLNRNNRVAVVVYAGNTNKSFSVADGITQLTLPLDSYTTSEDGVYLVADPATLTERFWQNGRWQERVVPNTNPYGLAVHGGVKNAAGRAVGNRFEVSTGTFMQDGIYEAMKLLKAADPEVKEGVQMGTKRLPIMVLMTDGESTLANHDYNGNDARTDLGGSTMHDFEGSTGRVGGYNYGHRDTISFMTSLTAAFAKKEIRAHYGSDPLFYTLPYGDTVMERHEALSVMNPQAASDIQNELWNRFLGGEEVTVYRYQSGNRNLYYTVENSEKNGEKLVLADRYYVDKYFPANNDDEMLRAFEDIVEEIIIQSKYYPTYVEGNHDHDGYLTFVDKIGAQMEVSDVKGIAVGNRLFSGAAIAKEFEKEELQEALIGSILQRMPGIDAVKARNLVKVAAEHGQMYYNSDTDFSHYIGWYSDGAGNFVDFWHEGIQTPVPSGATHIIKSYGFLGDTTVVPGVSNTDMMYMTVRVATALESGESIVTWRIPASLIPTITYDVEVEVDANGNITKLLDLSLEQATADSPIRLLYEVELLSGLEDWNLAAAMEEAGYDVKDGNGNYVFYSNKWSADPADTTRNTYSHFEPSDKNERYYYTQDTPVLYKDGESYKAYTGTKPAGNGYYHATRVFEKLENRTHRVHIHYEPISAEALATAEAADGGWQIPKGVVHRYYDDVTTAKTANTTATMGYSDYPFVVKEGALYYTYSTQGNNGKLTVAPATGIRLTKTLEAGYNGSESYTFKISGAIGDGQVVRLDASGNEASRSALPASGEVTLAAGETVYIVGLAAGSYTVTEQIPADAAYKVTAVKVDGRPVAGTQATLTLADRTVTPVEFVNGTKGIGSLIVSKDVNYPAGFAPGAAHNRKEFTVKVTFEGDLTDLIAPANVVKNGTVYTVKLKDGESVTFANLREGVTYTVEETDLSSGYTLNGIRYSDSARVIEGNDADQAHVVNDYTVAAVNPGIRLIGTKTVRNAWPANATFTMRLLEVTDLAAGTVLDTGLTATVSAADPAYEINLSNISFDRVGTYFFRLAEDLPAEQDRITDMVYDRSFGSFAVEVTDEDADGALEIKTVTPYGDTLLTGDAVNGWTVEKNFVNVITADRVILNLQKTVVDAERPGYTFSEHASLITFGLFEDQNQGSLPVYYVQTDSDGRAAFVLPVTKDALGEGKTYYLREIAPDAKDRVVGMHYDESWLYKITITWDDQNNRAVTVYDDLRDSAGEQTHTPNTVYAHTNTYTPNVVTAPLTFRGKKTLNGQNDLGGRIFTFALYDSTAAFVTDGAVPQTVPNQGNDITFTKTFDAPGLHYMVIKEQATNLGGVTVDSTEYHVTVLVEKYNDNGDSKLRVAAGYPHIVKYGNAGNVDANALNFNNLYTVSGETSVTIEATKVLTGRPMMNAEFSFLLEEANADGTLKQNGRVLEAENGAADGDTAKVTFEKLTYREAGVHYYRLTEKNGGLELSGVTHAKDSYLIKVTVTDNGVGGLESEWSIVEHNASAENLPAAATFTNVYRPDAAELKLAGVKELEGKPLADKEFTFRLTETDRGFENAVGTPKESQNNLHGLFAFDLFYDGVGTHYYRIEEVLPATPVAGMTYDETVFHVTVEVTDDHKGMLEATVTAIEKVAAEERIPASSVVFTNRYDAVDGTLTLSGTKELTGRELKDGEFTFELYEEGATAPKESVTNVGKSFTFAALTFDAAGEYTYTVREKKGEDPTITYDEKVYTVTVTVIDENGTLKATALVDGEEETSLVFKNTYTEEEKDPPKEEQDPPKDEQDPPKEEEKKDPPKSENPNTGDHSQIVLWMALLVISGGLFALLLAVKKRFQ